MPEGFAARPVTSAADAAAYVDGYVRALGVEDVRAARVLGFGSTYWVYAAEVRTGHPAFSLTVGADGEIQIRKFPAMDPEMMWNQKYGHEARPNAELVDGETGAAGAAQRLRQALPADHKVEPGKVSAYYGYFLFPLCEGDRLVGEGAVEAGGGKVVWKRFPEAPRSTWLAPGVDARLCD
jgi:hypothetical protein